MLRRLSIFLAAGSLVLALGAAPTLAAGGSVHVTSSCDYPSLEDNSIVAGTTLYVWVKTTNLGSGSMLSWAHISTETDRFG